MANTTATTPATTAAPLGELLHLDPHAVEIDVNVRTEASLTPEFIASIAEDGVEHPLTAIRRADGTIAIRDGQRRTLASRQAGLATIPVYVTDESTGDDTQRVVARIKHQFGSFQHRAPLTGKDRLQAMTQMLDLGLTPAKVAKELYIDRKQVAAATVARKSETATAAYDSGSLTLEQAAVLVEFEDTEGASERLATAAMAGKFDHAAAEMRQERETRRSWQAAADSYTADGYTVLEEKPSWNDQTNRQLCDLVTAERKTAELEHVTDKTLLTVYLEEVEEFFDSVTGEPVDEDTVDWDTKNDADMTPEEGFRHAYTVQSKPAWEPHWYCTDPAAARLQGRYSYSGSSSTAVEADPAAAAAKKDAESAARRQTLRFNKLGDAALTVRRAWVSELLARKTPPTSAAVFVASALAAELGLLSQNKTATTATEMLGIADGGLPGAIATATPARAQVLTLALVLGAYESRTTKDSWKNEWYKADIERYLHFLAELGYPLSEIEEVAAGDRTPGDVSAAE